MLFTILNTCAGACLWVAFLLCSVTTATAAENVTPRLTLKKALTLTLAHNPQLYQYRFIRQALAAQRQTAALRPAFSLALEADNVAGTGDKQGLDSAEITIALSSVIELGGKRRARAAFGNARINQAEWKQQVATLDTLGKLTEVYIESLATQANVRLAKESLELSLSLLKTVQARSIRGASPEAEVMRAQAAFTRAEIRLAALQEQFERQKVLLARFWGKTNLNVDVLEGNLYAFTASRDFDQLFAMIQSSPALQVLASEARIQDAAITLARASGRGDLSWRAGIKRFEETGESAFTAGISIPLFSGKRSRGEVTAALANRNAVDYAQRDLILQLHARLFEAWSLRKQSIAAAVKTQKVAIPALEKALTLTKDAYENGRYRYLDLLAAQEELLASKQTLIDTATTALVSQALIEQLTGEALNP